MAIDHELCAPENIHKTLSKLDDNVDLSQMFLALGMTDFTGLDFGRDAAAEFELEKIEFVRAEYNNTKFNSANLEGVQFKFCNLNRVLFTEAEASGIQFLNNKLTRCTFFHANLKSAVVTACEITGCRFDYADMTGAIMANNTQSITEKLNTVNQDNSHALETTLSELQPGDRVSFKQTNLSNADISGLCLFGADLRGANLTGTNLINTDLRYSNLVNVTGAESNLTFCEASLSHAKINRELAHSYEFDFYETDQPDIVKIGHPPFANLMASTGS